MEVALPCLSSFHFFDWQYLLSVADCKDGNPCLLYPVYYPVVAVYQLSYALIAGLRERAAALRECLEATHFAEDGLNPLFRGGGIVACYVLRYLGNPLDCKEGDQRTFTS